MTLAEFLSSHGLSEALPLDGTFQRFNLYGKNDGWFVGKKLPSGVVASAGSWKTGDEWSFHNGSGAGGDLAAEVAEMRALQAKDKEAGYEACQNKTIKLVAGLKKPGPGLRHPYLKAKGFGELPELANVWLDKDDLLIGMYSAKVNHQLVGAQRITPAGDKRFQRGVRLGGSYHILKGLSQESSIIFCEGYATGLSIWLAMDRTCHVVVCFTAGNLLPVADSLAAHIRSDKVFFAADNDQWTVVRGKQVNAGLDAATMASQKFKSKLLVPHFENTDTEKRTDFNDHLMLYGKDHLRTELLYQMTSQDGPEAPIEEGEPLGLTAAMQQAEEAFDLKSTEAAKMPDLGNAPDEEEPQEGDSHNTTEEDTHWSKRPQPGCLTKDNKKPLQEVLAQALLHYFGEDICRQGDDVFSWQGTHWELQDFKNFRHKCRRIFQRMAGGLCGNHDLNNTYEMFVSMVRPVPDDKNMFTPNPYVISLSDGTLWLNDMAHTLQFTPGHRRQDYLTRTIPFAWESPIIDNDLLIKYLDRCFGDDPDKAGKIRAMQQAAGASLMPAYPHIYFFYGVKGSGKSTLAKLCGLLVGDKNRSRVQPKEMGGKLMTTMINKMVNIHTDISYVLIDDSILKLVEDQEPISIDRKYLAAVDAFIPSLHLFCCNKMPRSLDGSEGTYDRRVTIIKYDKNITGDGLGYSRKYERTIFDHNPQAVFSWARQGLIDLVQSKGLYFIPDSSQKEMDEWNERSDAIGQFLADIDQNEVIDKTEIRHKILKKCEPIKLNNATVQLSSIIRRSSFYESFYRWCPQSGIDSRWYPRKTFFAELRKRGILFSEYKGTWYMSTFVWQFETGPGSGGTI